jgi:hypothetical protein
MEHTQTCPLDSFGWFVSSSLFPMDSEISQKLQAVTELRGKGDVRTEHFARMVEFLAVIAQQQAEAADKLQRQTQWLIYLTWALVFLSTALLATAFIQTKIMFKQDAETHIQHVQASQPDRNPSTDK